MKLSISWIFKHIQANWQEVDIENLINKFSLTTAEIESANLIKFDISNFTLVKITAINNQNISAYSQELKKTIELSARPNLVQDGFYLIKKTNKEFSWASTKDFGSSKDDLLPKLFCIEEKISGAWKNDIDKQDWILIIDNASLTHRPDLWSHRGFAREMAAILNKKLKPEEDFLIAKPIKHYDNVAPSTSNSPISLEINKNTSNACKRIAGLYFDKIDNFGSDISMAINFSKLDAKPINFIVDATNYVMLDYGQPMHAFDASLIKDKIESRFAFEGEKINLLDGQEIKLTPEDMVIADSERPLALAGIMGGAYSSIKLQTNSIFLESANFDATTIRKSASKFKIRTEASTRFEKNLDPNQNTQAILRFLKILNDYNINYNSADSIASLGKLVQERSIEVSHEFINNKIGMSVSSDSVENILTKLGFGVQSSYDKTKVDANLIYKITVPTYRSTKDITIAEDIVEEIIRSIGYDNVPFTAPSRAMVPFDFLSVKKLSQIKHHVAFALEMNEIQTYALFDEEFLKKIDFQPTDYIEVVNPISENYKKLITTLMPNLLKTILINEHKQDYLAFFEIDRVWFMDNNQAVESAELSGIFYDRKKELDFYEFKSKLNSLFDLLKIEVIWQKPQENLDFWYNTNLTAEILYKDRVIGTAGKLSAQILNIIGQGDGFIFEIDSTFLTSFIPPKKQFKALAKYPESHLDISLLIDQKITVKELEQKIKQADSRIIRVSLLDFFHKKEWGLKRSLTFRYIIYDENNTLSKEEIDLVVANVNKIVQQLGAEIR